MTEIAANVVAYIGPRAVRTVLHFDEADPLAVSLIFPNQCDDDGQPVRWTFDRRLLADGLRGEAGIDGGDVRVWPEAGAVVVRLSTPEGVSHLYFDAAEVAGFVRRTRLLVPFGAERVDVDAALDRLLAGA